ncbi:MAG: hypothetical protein ACJ789_02235 [Thermomicrobiales bacterium]
MRLDSMRRDTDYRPVPTQGEHLLARIEATGVLLARSHELIARSWCLLEPKPPQLLHKWQEHEQRPQAKT